MPDLDTAAELRSLQAKAYGRDGGLTHAEAARLRELETPPSLPVPAAPEESEEPRAIEPTVPEQKESGSTADPTDAEHPSSEPVHAREDDHAPDSWRTALRHHWRIVAVASAVLLAIGMGTGWALFTPRVRDAVPLSQEEVERKIALDEKHHFDEGTLRAVARDDDALVWFGEKDDGAQNCIVLDAAGQSQIGCANPEDMSVYYGLTATVSLPPDEDAPLGGLGSSVNAFAMLSSEGEPMVSIQRWDHDASMLEQYDEAIRPRAEALMTEEGFRLGLTLVGYFRGEPVWSADREGESGQIDRCLLVDALDAVECLPDTDALRAGLGVSTVDRDGRAMHVGVQFSKWGQPYMTVTGETTVLSFEVDVDSGDPIEVTSPQGDAG